MADTLNGQSSNLVPIQGPANQDSITNSDGLRQNRHHPNNPSSRTSRPIPDSPTLGARAAAAAPLLPSVSEEDEEGIMNGSADNQDSSSSESHYQLNGGVDDDGGDGDDIHHHDQQEQHGMFLSPFSSFIRIMPGPELTPVCPLNPGSSAGLRRRPGRSSLNETPRAQFHEMDHNSQFQLKAKGIVSISSIDPSDLQGNDNGTDFEHFSKSKNAAHGIHGKSMHSREPIHQPDDSREMHEENPITVVRNNSTSSSEGDSFYEEEESSSDDNMFAHIPNARHPQEHITLAHSVPQHPPPIIVSESNGTGHGNGNGSLPLTQGVLNPNAVSLRKPCSRSGFGLGNVMETIVENDEEYETIREESSSNANTTSDSPNTTNNTPNLSTHTRSVGNLSQLAANSSGVGSNGHGRDHALSSYSSYNNLNLAHHPPSNKPSTTSFGTVRTSAIGSSSGARINPGNNPSGLEPSIMSDSEFPSFEANASLAERYLTLNNSGSDGAGIGNNSAGPSHPSVYLIFTGASSPTAVGTPLAQNPRGDRGIAHHESFTSIGSVLNVSSLSEATQSAHPNLGLGGERPRQELAVKRSSSTHSPLLPATIIDTSSPFGQLMPPGESDSRSNSLAATVRGRGFAEGGEDGGEAGNAGTSLSLPVPNRGCEESMASTLKIRESSSTHSVVIPSHVSRFLRERQSEESATDDTHRPSANARPERYSWNSNTEPLSVSPGDPRRATDVVPRKNQSFLIPDLKVEPELDWNFGYPSLQEKDNQKLLKPSNSLDSGGSFADDEADDSNNSNLNTTETCSATPPSILPYPAELMPRTPLYTCIETWYAEECLFTRMLTSFTCSPIASRKLAGDFLLVSQDGNGRSLRSSFRRLLSPFCGFGYEVQRYCMRYLNGYSLAEEVRLVQDSQEGREGYTKVTADKLIGRTSGGSDPRPCGCDDGFSCARAGPSSRCVNKPSYLLPLPRFEDMEDSLSHGLGCLETPPPSDEPKKLEPERSGMFHWPRPSNPPPVKGKEKAICTAGYPLTPDPTTSSAKNSHEMDEEPVAPARKRTKRVPDDCPRLPRLDLSDVEGSTPCHSMTSAIHSSLSAAASEENLRAKTLEPLTEAETNCLTDAIDKTTSAVTDIRIFMNELSEEYHCGKGVADKDNPSINEKIEAHRKFAEELLPQCDTKIRQLVSVFGTQSARMSAVLDGVEARSNHAELAEERARPKEKEQKQPAVAGTNSRGTASWAKASAAELAMSGCLLPINNNNAAAIASIPSNLVREGHAGFLQDQNKHRNTRVVLPVPFRHRLSLGFTRAQFAVIRQLSRVEVFDRFTSWSLSRLDGKIDRIREDAELNGEAGVKDESSLAHRQQSGAALMNLKYSVLNMEQEIQARKEGRRLRIGIADTLERMSLDDDEWVEFDDGRGSEGWVMRVLGPPKGTKRKRLSGGRVKGQTSDRRQASSSVRQAKKTNTPHHVYQYQRENGERVWIQGSEPGVWNGTGEWTGPSPSSPGHGNWPSSSPMLSGTSVEARRWSALSEEDRGRKMQRTGRDGG